MGQVVAEIEQCLHGAARSDAELRKAVYQLGEIARRLDRVAHQTSAPALIEAYNALVSAIQAVANASATLAHVGESGQQYLRTVH